MGSLHKNTIELESSKSNPLDHQEFRKQAHRIVDFIADYYQKIETYPVLPQVQPGFLRNKLPQKAPDTPEPLDDIMNDVNNHILPGVTHWSSPNFFAFFPSSGSTAAFLGEMLSNCFNSVGFNWVACPAATELEMVVMDWLGKMLELPASFMFSGTGGGVIQNTTSESVLVTLVAARDRMIRTLGDDDNTNTNSKFVTYASDQAHATFAKASKIAGIDPRNVRLLPTKFCAEFALSPELLRKQLEADVADGLIPLYLCLTVGTTSTTAVDPLKPLADLAREYDMWVHVDAAYAGNACICPEFRSYLDGIELVDSLSLSLHKWLLSHLEYCCLWVKKPTLLVNALSTNPEYLKNKPSESDSVVDYKDWQVGGTSRRFKSIRLWLVLRSYGVTQLQNHIRSDVRMAIKFEEFVKSDPRFEMVVPRKFALVCFRLNPTLDFGSVYIESLNRKLLEWINVSGQIYLSHTIVGGIYMLRFVVGATLTEDRHVEAAWELIKKGADLLTIESLILI